ncbi:MAG: putative undecaprenyl-phosphate N-acetylglucosaminyl 1-phosphate transferase [Planctomycetota bacterium]
MPIYLTIFATALAATWLLTPLARRVALSRGITDRPDVRKQHRAPVPYLGGTAVFGGLLVGVVALMLLARDPAASFAKLDHRTLAVVLGAAAMFCTGLLDDLHNLRVRHKLLAQIGAATAMWIAGVRLDGIHLTADLSLDFGIFSYPLTVLWIVGITNAINFIDGLDGLASGIAVIAGSAIAWFAYQGGNYPVAALLALLVGSLLGFLPHNRHPARIFLGDAGSLPIGFLLATCALATNTKSAALISLVGPALALALPILDLCFAVARRWIERRSLFSADRNHIHHRLLALGFNHPNTVRILWAECAILTLSAVLLLQLGSEVWQRLLVVAAILGAHVWFFRATGAVRLRESFAALRAANARAQTLRWHQKIFDDIDLHFRAARSVDAWWNAMADACEKLQVHRAELTLPEGFDHGPRERFWSSDRAPGTATLRTTLVLPLGRHGGKRPPIFTPAPSRPLSPYVP